MLMVSFTNRLPYRLGEAFPVPQHRWPGGALDMSKRFGEIFRAHAWNQLYVHRPLCLETQAGREPFWRWGVNGEMVLKAPRIIYLESSRFTYEYVERALVENTAATW